jgi:Flp pilus assembly protein TadD
MLTNISYPQTQDSSCSLEALQLLDRGQYEAAQQRLAMSPNACQDPHNLVHQAVCFIHLGQSEAALWLCDRALQLAPRHPQAWLFKGVALHRLGRYSEAYDCYRRATDTVRPMPTAVLNTLASTALLKFKALWQRLDRLRGWWL